MRRSADRSGSRNNLGGNFSLRRKIVFFTTGMTAGGAERVIATLSNALAEQGFEVVIAMMKGNRSEYELTQGVMLRSADLSPGLKNLPNAMRFYRNLIKQEKPDVIVSFPTKSNLVALVSRLLYRTPGRLIVSDRADPYTRNRTMQLACNILYGKSDALVCQSKRVADYYRKNCSRADISVIPNPLNEDCVGEPTRKDKSPVVVSVGRLSEEKNHRLAIGAFKEILSAFPGLKLRIFGSGPLEGELEAMIRAEHLEGSVILEGVIPNVIRANGDAALFLFTSNHEGYPNALIEAAATGIPIVTTDFSPGTAREIVDPGVNGYITPVGDHAAVANAAIKALSGGLEHDKIVEASRRVREKHRTERILEVWLTVLNVR